MPGPPPQLSHLVELCDRPDQPGLCVGEAEYVDWSGKETTPDQGRIEDALEALGPQPDERILHVGVGNSELAQRFASRVAAIDGLTVARSEKVHADRLAIPNYRVYVLNKHSREFRRTIGGTYDYVVDNNLVSFACCRFHLFVMFDNYLCCLAPGGRILTDQEGFAWQAALDAPGWSLDYEDLCALAAMLDLRPGRLTDTVYELRRGP